MSLKSVTCYNNVTTFSNRDLLLNVVLFLMELSQLAQDHLKTLCDTLNMLKIHTRPNTTICMALYRMLGSKTIVQHFTHLYNILQLFTHKMILMTYHRLVTRVPRL